MSDPPEASPEDSPAAEGPPDEVPLYVRPQPEKPSRLVQAAEVTEKVAVGCFSCAALTTGLIGSALGLGGGALYHALLASEGSWPLLAHLGAGAALGFLAGLRVVVPIEDLAFDYVEERLPGGPKSTRRGKRRGPG